ncbi:50S ribosomal protein L33 [Candidatus Aerophobetes bacterium]|nr:50S ribosomal protein L33 [Candidatus Aerophobetes bacterium]
MVQVLVNLVCSECKRRNYVTTRNKKNPSLSLKKYCKFCKKHTLHKEK